MYYFLCLVAGAIIGILAASMCIVAGEDDSAVDERVGNLIGVELQGGIVFHGNARPCRNRLSGFAVAGVDISLDVAPVGRAVVNVNGGDSIGIFLLEGEGFLQCFSGVGRLHGDLEDLA